MSSLIQYHDNVSVYDVIDLDHDDYSTDDDRSSSQHHYHHHISLDSIDDDELRLFRRDLVTPAPSVFAGEDADNMKRNMIRTRFVPPSRIQRPISRGESVMLFKKINNGDEDVTFDDLVSSEFRDFLDTDFLMDATLSRPASRTTTDKNASEIIQSTVSLTDNEHRQQVKHQRTTLPSKLRSLSISKSNQAQTPSVPAEVHDNNHRQFHQQRTPIATVHYSRDDHLYKKPVTMIPKQTSSSRDKHALKTAQPQKVAHSYLDPPSVPISTRRQAREPTRNYGRKLQEPELQPVTARFPPRKFIVPHQTSIHNDYVCRTRSDTTTSSSSEDEPKEEPAGHYPFMPSHRRTYASQPLTFDHYNNNAPLFHRYIKPASSTRLKTMTLKKTFPTATTTYDDADVIDSATQLLASIRERRKRMNVGTL